MKSRLHAHIGTFRQLELLLAVQETGSIKGAAERLFIAQPSVSIQLKKLSEAVGMPLYNQIGKKLVFTEAGLAVLETAERVLGDIDRLDMQLSDMKGVKTGLLSLAVVTSSKYFAPHLMGAFSKKYPGVEVQLKVGNREEIIERLKNDKDDFYIFSHLPEDVDTFYENFLTNPLIAIASKKSSLIKRSRISLNEFAECGFISREQGSGTRYAIEQFLESRNVTLKQRMVIESNEAIKHAVMSDLGVSILSAHSLSFTAGNSDLGRVNVQGLPIQTSWYIAWSKRKQHSPVAREFENYFKSEGKDTLQKVLKKNRFIDS